VGRDSDEIVRSVGAQGPPNKVGPAYLAAGATLFTVGVHGPHYDLSRLRDWISWRDAQ
jgi:hypothetical protein